MLVGQGQAHGSRVNGPKNCTMSLVLQIRIVGGYFELFTCLCFANHSAAQYLTFNCLHTKMNWLLIYFLIEVPKQKWVVYLIYISSSYWIYIDC